MSSPENTEVSTADLIKRRLVGLLVLLALVFSLSVLLRGLGSPSVDESGLQTVVVPLTGGDAPAADTAAVLAAPEPEAVAEEPAPTESPTESISEAAQPTSSVPQVPTVKPARPTPAAAAPSAAESKPAKKPSVPTPETGKKQRWFIVLGSFSDAANARALAQRAKAAGFSTDISRIQSGGTSLNRVRVGPFKNEAEAQSARATLIVEGLTGAKLQREP